MDNILQDLYDNRITPEEAKKYLESGYLDINGIAKFDFMRQSRCGIPEIVISEGKDYPHLLEIVNTTYSRLSKL